MTEIKWAAHFPAEAMDVINSLLAEREKLRAELELLRQDNHSLWGSLRNRMAADAARTLPR